MSWPSTVTVPAVGVDDAADDADQRGLAGAVGPEQREDLAAPDVEVDVLQRLEARGIGLGQVGDGDDGVGMVRSQLHVIPVLLVGAGEARKAETARNRR